MADESEVFETFHDKVVLIGDVNVGKTSIFSRFVTGKFEPTGKDAEKSKSWTLNGSEVSITLFDTAGMERYMGTIPHSYFRNANVLLLVYSINEVDSFDSLTSWSDNALSAQMASGLEPPTAALVGNKIDLESERDVSRSRVERFAELNGIDRDMIFEVSALEDNGIKEMFDAIALKIYPKVGQRVSEAAEQQTRNKTPKLKCCTK